MEWKDSNITLPLPKRNELTSLIEQNGVRMEVPAKKVFLKPGDTLNGVYYIAEGRTGRCRKAALYPVGGLVLRRDSLRAARLDRAVFKNGKAFGAVPDPHAEL